MRFAKGVLLIAWAAVGTAQASRYGPPVQSLVAVNEVRLEYLDWGGAGPVILFVPGLGDDPHVFASIASDLGSHFHILSFARRGFGGSSGTGPYDVDTLSDDIAGLMDALQIGQAHLTAMSAGADDATRFADVHPERVKSLSYLEGAYDWSSPAFKAAVAAAPPVSAFSRPASAMASWGAFVAYEKATWYPTLTETRDLEVLLRNLMVIRRDGTLEDRVPADRASAHLSALLNHAPKNYGDLTCPVLAIYGQTLYDLASRDSKIQELAPDWEQRYWAPFQAQSLARIQHEARHLSVVRIPGAHVNILLTQHKRIARQLRAFLLRASLADALGDGK